MRATRVRRVELRSRTRLLTAALLLFTLGSTAAGAIDDPALRVRAVIDGDRSEVTVRVEIPVPTDRALPIELRALPLAETRIVGLRARWEATSGEAGAEEAAILRSEPKTTDRAARTHASTWTAEARAAPSDAQRLVLDYAVTGATAIQDDHLVSIIPLIVPLDAVLAPRFDAEVEIPASFSPFSAFPSELASAASRPAGEAEGAPSATVHSVSLPATVALLRIEAQRGRTPWITLQRSLDLVAFVLLALVIGAGVAHLRRETRAARATSPPSEGTPR